MSAFQVSVRPRFGEVDSMGVVYHVHYLVYFELGRTEYMRALGVPYAGIEARGYHLAVLNADVRYRQPAHYDEELTVDVGLSAVGHASVTFSYALRRGERLLATGSTRLGCLDRDHRPSRLPPDVLAILRAGRDASPAASEGA